MTELLIFTFGAFYPKIPKENGFSTDNLLQFAIFHKVLSLKLKELEFFLNVPFFK